MLATSVAFALAGCRSQPTPLRPDGKTVYLAANQRWRLTKVAGAVPEPRYEQSYVRLDRLGPADEVLEFINFEERAWVRSDGAERVWVEFSLDGQTLQALQHQRDPSGKETRVRMRWNAPRSTARRSTAPDALPTKPPPGVWPPTRAAV